MPSRGYLPCCLAASHPVDESSCPLTVDYFNAVLVPVANFEARIVQTNFVEGNFSVDHIEISDKKVVCQHVNTARIVWSQFEFYDALVCFSSYEFHWSSPDASSAGGSPVVSISVVSSSSGRAFNWSINVWMRN